MRRRPVVRLSVIFTLVAALGASTLLASPTDPSFLTVPAMAGPASRSLLVNGAKGGQLVLGRYQVDVPPRAFAGMATITLCVPDPTRMRCELSISPASANHFVFPVTLVANCTGSRSPMLEVQTVTLDPSTGIWNVVPGTIANSYNLTLYTPLWHFSSYGQVGNRAGW